MFDALFDLFKPSEKARAAVRVRGHVYEGKYNLHVEDHIRKNSLKGWLRITHLPMESVLEAEVEGAKHRIERFVTALGQIPAGARIQRAEVAWKTFKGQFRDFRSHH